MAEQTITLALGEGKVVSFEAIPPEAKIYRVSVNGLTGSFVATLPPLDGRFVIAYAWWEGLPDWTQISPRNEWPASTAILTRWNVENIGDVAAEFRVEFMGQASSIMLNPGESGSIELTVSTGDPGTYSYPVNLYANETPVDSFTMTVTLVSPMPRKPDYLNGELVGVDYGTGWPAKFTIKNTGTTSAGIGVDFRDTHSALWRDPGQTGYIDIYSPMQEGTNTYPYYIYVRDPDTGEEWIVEEGSLTVTGI